jgi:hypothetical protein
MNPLYYPTCVGQLELTWSNQHNQRITARATASGNARQRRRVIRAHKRAGWTVYSCLRTAVDSVIAVAR